MKNRSKIIIGIFLITGAILLGYMGTTNMNDGFPPEQDPTDPGNGKGPGLGSFTPPEQFEFIISVDVVINSLI